MPDSAILGVEGRGLRAGAELRPPEPHPAGGIKLHLVWRGALFGIDESVRYARERKPSWRGVARAIRRSSSRWVELATQAEMLRLLIF